MYVSALENAKGVLDEDGYTDGAGNGIREYKGKDIKLRPRALSESPESQSCGKIITGWLEDIGLDIDYQVIGIDLAERSATGERMQQIVYAKWPYILPLVYPLELEAYNDTVWEGWEQASGGRRPPRRRPAGVQDAKLRYGRQLSWMSSTCRKTNAAGEGGRGWRSSRSPARCGGRSPFLRLHGAHEVTRLFHVSGPPLERGTTWSTVRWRSLPQYWQR